ncbi:hypothetical protein C6497_10495 [Candidatus Poribacteria bacterium]|nr:MAG: hypothetical protein C6497_10495 [Candidatus Poribacteria bacterium]
MVRFQTEPTMSEKCAKLTPMVRFQTEPTMFGKSAKLIPMVRFQTALTGLIGWCLYGIIFLRKGINSKSFLRNGIRLS